MSTYKRLLTSHLSTTGANVKGFASLVSLNTAADFATGAINLGQSGLYKVFMADDKAATKYFNRFKGSYAGAFRRGTDIISPDVPIGYADAVLELFRKRDVIENFNKKALYIMIREMTGSNTQHITRVINQMKKYYANMITEFSSVGQIDTSNTGSIF